MEKVENKSPLECLQEEIRVFRKNEETTYDISALYGLLLQHSPFCDLAILTLVERSYMILIILKLRCLCLLKM